MYIHEILYMQTAFCDICAAVLELKADFIIWKESLPLNTDNVAILYHFVVICSFSCAIFE